jgi:hypothetical protein
VCRYTDVDCFLDLSVETADRLPASWVRAEVAPNGNRCARRLSNQRLHELAERFETIQAVALFFDPVTVD